MSKVPTKHKYNKEISATFQLYSQYYLSFWKKIQTNISQAFPQFSTIHQNIEKVQKPTKKQVPVRKGQDANETIMGLNEELSNIYLQEKIKQKQQVFMKKQKNNLDQESQKIKIKTQKQQQPKMIISSINELISQPNSQKQYKHKQNKLARTNSTKQLKSIIAESANSYEQQKQSKQKLIITNDTRTQPPSKQESNQRDPPNKAITTKKSQCQIDQLRTLYQQSEKKAEMMMKQNRQLKIKMSEMSQQMSQQKQMMAQILASLKQGK